MCAARSISTTRIRDKLALVIGNNNYQARNRLENPENDARDMADALRKIHFDVESCINASYGEMECQLNTLIENIESNDMVLFYFAGHGHQWEDQNYLIPSDDDYIEGENIKYYAFNVQDILNRITEKKPFVIILLLDCCREYHLRHRDLRDVGRGLPGSEHPKGLKKIYTSSPSANSLIAFACAAGHIASDVSANGRNGLFTWHLLQHIEKSNQDIAMVLRDVARDVHNETRNNTVPQVPWINCSLKDRNIFLHSLPNLDFDLQAIGNEKDVKDKDDEELNRNLFGQLKVENTIPFATTAVEASTTTTTIKEITEKSDNYDSRYAEDYQTVKAIGKGGFGYVFEAINKLDGRHLAVKRISLKNKREQEKALNEVRALVQLDHPYIIRYIQAWLETPPLGWQNKEDTTYDWRDISRSDTHLATDLEAMHANTSTTATTISVQKDSDEELYDLNCFLKPTSLREKSSRNDNTQSGNTSHTSDRSAEMKKDSQRSEVRSNADQVTEISASYKDNLSIDSETSLSQVEQHDIKVPTKTSYLYYSMELCKGDTLEHRLSPYVLTKKQTCEILDQITVGIAYIHEKNLIHGDIKPANIFFSVGNSIKIGDFGLAAEMFDSNEATIDGRRAHGTYGYMAPELRKTRQEIQYDEKVDIYAMGIVFLELLAPFKTDSVRSEVLEKIRRCTKKNLDITPIFTSYEKAVDLNLSHESIIMWLLKPLATERPSAKELLDDKSFRRVIKGIHVDKFLTSARWVRQIDLQKADILHGCFGCSEELILLNESDRVTLFNITGQKLVELPWNQENYFYHGHIAQIRWSVYLNAFLVLAHRALFKLKYSNFQMITERIGPVYAPNIEVESRLRFMACGSKNDHLFLNRGYHTIQQYKMAGWTKHREWTKRSLNYEAIDEIRDTTVDRNGEYLVMNVRIKGNTWLIDVRTIDENLTQIKQISGFHHKLQLFSPSSHWLILRGDPNKLYLYDVKDDEAQIAKEVSFGDNEGDPQFSFSKTAPIHFRWMGETHLLLGTVADKDQTGALKIYRV